jgi:hypothetical protein
MKREGRKDISPVAASEAVRLRRLREDAGRPISENLAEAIALSHKLIRFSNTLQKN